MIFINKIKNRNALEDPTFENLDVSDLGGGPGRLGFSSTAGIIFEVERSSWYQIECYGRGKFSMLQNVYFMIRKD